MEVKLKSKRFQNETMLCEWVNQHDYEIYTIVRDLPTGFVLFYWEDYFDSTEY